MIQRIKDLPNTQLRRVIKFARLERDRRYSAKILIQEPLADMNWRDREGVDT